MPNTLPAANLAEARRLREEGRPGEALELIRHAVAASPDAPEVWSLLAAASLDLAELPEAEQAYCRTLELDPTNRDALLGAGLVLQAQGRHAEARVGWEHAAATLVGDPVAPTLLGVNLMRAGEMVAAEKWFREALLRYPGHADALAGLGSILERTGRGEEGTRLLESAVRGRHPHGAVAAIMARCLLGEQKPAAALDVLDRALAGGPNRTRRVQLEHVRGEVLEHLDRPEEAFAAYDSANGLRTARFDGPLHLAAVRRITKIFDRATLADLPRGSDHEQGSILVVGVPRSGTSLITRMLSRHPDIAGAGELDTWRLLAVELGRRWQLPPGDIWYNHLERLDRPLLDACAAAYRAEIATHAHGGQQLVVDKMPHNIFQLPLAALALPGTVVVHALRDPLDTGWSCFRQNFTDGLAWSTSLSGIGLYLRAERELMHHWKRVLDIPVVTVHYEDLTADPRAALEPVLAAGGLQWDDDLLEFHRDVDYLATASYREVRRPLYRSSVGRAETFAEQLAPLQHLLAAFGPLP